MNSKFHMHNHINHSNSDIYNYHDLHDKAYFPALSSGKTVYFYNTSIAGMLGNTPVFLKKMEYVFRCFAGRICKFLQILRIKKRMYARYIIILVIRIMYKNDIRMMPFTGKYAGFSKEDGICLPLFCWQEGCLSALEATSSFGTNV